MFSRIEARPRSVEITDPLLLDFAKTKEAAFSVAFKHLNEVWQELDRRNEELVVFKNKVLKTLQGFEHESSPPSSRQTLSIERDKLKVEYNEFKSDYVKVSTLTYRVQETVSYLKPAYRNIHEEHIFQENAPNFHAQNQELDRLCTERAEKLEALCTKVLRQKAKLHSYVFDFALTGALEKLNALTVKKEPPSSRASQLLNYMSSYGSVPEEDSPPPTKPRQRASLQLLSTDPGLSPRKKTPTYSLPTSPLNSKRTPLAPLDASTRGSPSPSPSPRILEIPAVRSLSRRRSVDSWESIPLSSRSGSAARFKKEQTSSSSYSSRPCLPMSSTESWETRALTGKTVTSLARSYGRDAGSSSIETYKKLRSSPDSERKTPSLFQRERRLSSSPGSETTQTKVAGYYRRGIEEDLFSSRKKLSSSGETPSIRPRNELPRTVSSREKTPLPHSLSERGTFTPPREERAPRQRGVPAQEVLKELPRLTRQPSQEPPKVDRSKRRSWKAFIPHKKEGS